MTTKIDEKKATNWLLKAEEVYPNDKIVLDLKEKLLNLKNGESGESKSLETFLISSLDENFMNEDLHLKLLKVYLKSTQCSKAMRHLAKIEYKELFATRTWYENVVELIEASLDKANNEHESHLLLAILSILLMHQLHVYLQSEADIDSVIEIFLKFDKYITSVNNLKSNKRLVELMKAELRSQFYFALGLVLNRFSRSLDITSDKDPSEDEINMSALLCLAKSSLFSKPSSLDAAAAADDNDTVTATSEQASLEKDLLKLLQRESALRYTIIGNSILFAVARLFNDDQIEFFEQLKLFSLNHDVKTIVIRKLDLDTKKFNKQDSFITNVGERFFNFENDKLIVFDHLTLNLAEKLTFENKMSNLRFLIWYCLINTRFDENATNSAMAEIPPYILFRASKNITKQLTGKKKFGVNNLNICNIESLSLMDLKIFLYSVYYESLSYVNRDERTPAYIHPFYHPQALSLGIERRQIEWWSRALATMLALPTRVSHKRKSWTNTPIDDPTPQTASSSSSPQAPRQQSDFCKILELVRLKSSSVRLHDATYFKCNLKICSRVANYLQYLNASFRRDMWQEVSVVSDNGHSTGRRDFEDMIFRHSTWGQEMIDCPAKEKLEFFTIYLDRYSSYVREQASKLKQIERLETNDFERVELAAADMDLFEASVVLDEMNTSLVCSKPSNLGRFNDYFVYYESKYNAQRRSKPPPKTPIVSEEKKEQWVVVERASEKEEVKSLASSDLEFVEEQLMSACKIGTSDEAPKEAEIVEDEKKSPEKIEEIVETSKPANILSGEGTNKQETAQIQIHETAERVENVKNEEIQQYLSPDKPKTTDIPEEQISCVDSEKNKKFLDLMQLMRSQTSKHLQILMDTLTEQNELIRGQFDQIDYQIKLLDECINRRMQNYIGNQNQIAAALARNV